MAANFPECPPSLRPIAHYLKTAQEHGKSWIRNIIHFLFDVYFDPERMTNLLFVYLFIAILDARDIVVAYWSRLHALQTGLKLTTKQPEETALLLGKYQILNS